jgi:DNA-binding protein H-NS
MSTYRQLKQQIAELEKKATIAIKKEARTVIERIKQQIAEFGLTAADLGLEIARRAAVKTRAKRTKRVLTPKYREPTTGKTWNGHGKRPGWIVAAQKKGKLEELLIAKPALAGAAPQAKPAKKSAAKKAQTKATPLPKRAAKNRAKKPAAAAPKKRVAERKAAATKPVAKKRAAPAKRPQRAATRATPAPTEVTA